MPEATPKREATPKESWHFDKRIPLALLFGLVAHAGVFVWTFSALNTRVGQLELYVSETKQMGTSDRLVRLETHMENIFKELQAVNRKLDRQAAPPRR